MTLYDCHAHVYERTRTVGNPRYRPSAPAPLHDWQRHLAEHGLAGGVLVQPSFLDTDNGELLRALRQTGTGHFRAVAGASLHTPPETLAEWHRAGVRGIRWNLVAGAPLPDLDDRSVRDFLLRLQDAEMHLEVHLEAPRLRHFLPRLCQRAGRVVVDHFGLPSSADADSWSWFRALPAQEREAKLWVKLSAPYRSDVAEDTERYLRALGEHFPADRFVWGSDWPWTRFEGRHGYGDTVGWARAWQGAGIDVDAGARSLYGLG